MAVFYNLNFSEMKKYFTFFLSFFAVLFIALRPALAEQYPNISGQALVQFKTDRIMSTDTTGVSPNNAYVNIEQDLALNFSKNWSAKTLWRINPSDVYTTRDAVNPERTRTFLSDDRGLNLSNGLLVEELKAQYEDEDMRFFAGKFNPSYGTAYKNDKRIGVFSADITKDYELREKIGGGVTALLEGAEISINTFFNDTTGLSGSINGRDREQSDDGLAGNTGTLSSYSVSVQGDKLFGYENWFYNAGYRNLGVKQNGPYDRSRETGYVLGSEYLHKLAYNTSVIPFVEVTKIDNFTGERGRDATYTTMALIGKYSGWTASISQIYRTIKQPQRTTGDIKDYQTQLSLGYKFMNNFALDVSRAHAKESNQSLTMIGVMLSYVHKY